jgi:pimeloyl-ACP methyl ester carboxylesterase
MTLPIFKEGILSDGTYNLKLLGETIDVNNFNKRNLPLRLFFGKYDKVVPSESARAIADYVQDCKIYEFPGGHIDMCTKFDKGFQTPIIEEVEKIAKL